MNEIVSAVVLRYPKGYVAQLRFRDKKDDIDLSSNNHQSIYSLLERYVRRATT